MRELSGDGGLPSHTLLQKLGRMGGRIECLVAGKVPIGNAVYLLPRPPHDTLAEQERRAIVDTLHSTGWRLTETARRLGISRTTLWRRLRAYGVSRNDAGGDHNGDADGVTADPGPR